MKVPPPLRFLGMVLGGWVCLRAVVLVPGWIREPEHPASHGGMPSFQSLERLIPGAAAAPAPSLLLHPPSCRSCAAATLPLPEGSHLMAELADVPWPRLIISQAELASVITWQPAALNGVRSAYVVEVATATPSVTPPGLSASVSRLSVSAWAFVRGGGGPQLAPGGTLGGSQMGGRFSYRLNGNPARPLSLSGRLYSPLNRPQAAEVALGVEWKPVAAVPVRLLAERRQALGQEGKSAFSVLAHGGVADLKLAGPLRVNAYAQAGIVGLRSRDLFADGSAVVGLPLDDRGILAVGAGAWAAAQPGTSRLDVGPSLSVRVPVADRSIRVSADWRVRIKGKASPGSGPALTIGTDF